MDATAHRLGALREALARMCEALPVIAADEPRLRVAGRWKECAEQLLLPTESLMAQAPPAAIPPQAEPDGSGPRLRLLIAEDTDFNYELLKRFLRDQPYEVLRAHDGAQAVSMVRAGRCDLVLMDVQMPVLGGYAATRRIREWEAQHGRARMPVVLVSAGEAARQMRLGGDAGCSGCLIKPVSKAQLLTGLKLYGR